MQRFIFSFDRFVPELADEAERVGGWDPKRVPLTKLLYGHEDEDRSSSSDEKREVA